MGDGEMPVERIYLDETDERNARHIDVQWGREKPNINIGTTQDDPNAREDLGVFIDLVDRGQVNHLIRVLRKARDQAFGRDE
jgi:hypothetical protein